MPIQRPQLVNGEIYHIVIRGVGDTLILKNENDRYRGIFSIYEFNNANPVEIFAKRRKIRFLKSKLRKKVDEGEQFSVVLDLPDTRNHLVKILAFYFMPNHIHLLVRQIKNEGITQFMRKFGAGYATYFNKKYNRKGHLFQGRFKAVHVKTDDQLKIEFAYIHTNGVSLVEPRWKEKGIKNPKKVIKFLENYKWCSYPDYLGKKNFPSVTERDFMLKIMGGKQGCKKFIENWVKYKKKIKN